MHPLQCAVHPRIAEHQKEEPITLETIAAALAAHTSCPLSPAAATLHGKMLPPQHESHATFMEPLPCVLQHTAHIHAASHYNALCIHALQNTKEEPIA